MRKYTLRNLLKRPGAMARGAIGSFGVRLSGALLSLGLTFALTRTLGADGYGAYAFATSGLALTVMVALIGLDKLLVREVAAYLERQDLGRLRGLLRSATLIALGTSLLLGVLLAGLLSLSAGRIDEQMRVAAYIGILGLPLLVLARLRQSAMQGLGQVVTAQMPEFLLQPALVACLVLAMAGLLPTAFGPAIAMWAYVLALGAAFVVGARLLARALPAGYWRVEAVFQPGVWLRSTIPFAAFGILAVASREGIVLLAGLLSGQRETAYIQIAARLANLISFPLISINAPLAPAFASRFAAGDLADLRRKAVLGARYSLLISAGPALAFLVAGEWILSLFGEEFRPAYPALALLSAAQLVNAATGPVGLLLMMTNHERDATLSLTIATVSGLALAVTLIPSLGSLGAAAALAVAIATTHLLNAFQVYRRHGIVVTALTPLRPPAARRGHS